MTTSMNTINQDSMMITAMTADSTSPPSKTTKPGVSTTTTTKDKSEKRKSEEGRRKTVIDPKKKLEILDMNRRGASVSSLAKQFNIGEQTIRDWKKLEKSIQRMVESNKISHANRKTSRRSNFPETDAALGIWFCQQRFEKIR